MRKSYCQILKLIVIASLTVTTTTQSETAYDDRFDASGVSMTLWLNDSGKDKLFSDYIQDTKQAITKYGMTLPDAAKPNQSIEAAVGPHEWPMRGTNCVPGNTHGILLVHGLTDSPFLMRDLGDQLAAQSLSASTCVLVRSLLLPGHGTVPGDLLNVKYEDWINATGYALRSFAGITSSVHLVGFSTGGALGLYWAYHRNDLTPTVRLTSLVLLSPAIQTAGFFFKVPFLAEVAAWVISKTGYTKWMGKHADRDFAKYESFPTNAGYQIYRLDEAIKPLLRVPLSIPMFVVLAESDTTVNAENTVRYFKASTLPQNALWLVAQNKNSGLARAAKADEQKRVIIKEASIPSYHVDNFSHVSFTISPENTHYGSRGNYASCLIYAKDSKDAASKYCQCITKEMISFSPQCKPPFGGPWVYGENSNDHGVSRRLTFNPYFDEMTVAIREFLSAEIAK